MGQTLIGSGTQTKHISPGIGSRENLKGLHGKTMLSCGFSCFIYM
jgi:hypothetical protein